MKLPEQLINSLADLPGFDKEAFLKVHESGDQVTSIRVNPKKQSKIQNLKSKIPWSDWGYYLTERPSFTFDPLFHAGCYYVQEASSMFLEQALKQTVDLLKSLKILDLSAAPGGKSTHIASLISKDSLLVSNEVLRSRAKILQDNIIKWGCQNVVVTNNDPRDFSKLENYFDVIVVDAPCSGSGLFRKDNGAIKEWSEKNVQLCSQRQQRILANVWTALKNDGILIYSTCSYSREEDENIIDWMRSEFRVESLELRINKEWNIVETAGGYRFWPDKLMGEGFFLAVMQKTAGESESEAFLKPSAKTSVLSKNEKQIAEKWINPDGFELIKNNTTVYAWPSSLKAEMEITLENLRVLYSGIRVGELVREKLVPDHALAMSGLITRDIPRTELSLDSAIEYLRKEPLKLRRSTGWYVVCFQNHPLGWINILENRVNNYYPKALRILKER